MNAKILTDYFLLCLGNKLNEFVIRVVQQERLYKMKKCKHDNQFGFYGI